MKYHDYVYYKFCFVSLFVSIIHLAKTSFVNEIWGELYWSFEMRA